MWRCVGAGWEGEVEGMTDDRFYCLVWAKLKTIASSAILDI